MPSSLLTLLPLSEPSSSPVTVIINQTPGEPGDNKEGSDGAGLGVGIASAAAFMLGLIGYGTRKYRHARSPTDEKQSIDFVIDEEITTDDENDAPRLSTPMFPVCLNSKSLYSSSSSEYFGSSEAV